MKHHVALFALGVGLPLFAQPVAPVSLSSSLEANGGISVTIRNNSGSQITAYLVQVKLYEGAKLRMEIFKYMDVYVNAGSDKPLAPNESRVIPTVPPDAAARLRPEIALTRALFSDGTQNGIPGGLAILTGRRQRLGDALDRYQRIVQQAWLSGGRSATLAQISAQQDADRTDAKSRHLDIGLASVDDLVPHWLGRALATDAALCDQACTDAMYGRAMNGFLAWKANVTTGVTEIQSARQ